MPQRFTVGPAPSWFPQAIPGRTLNIPADYPMPINLSAFTAPDGQASALEIEPYDPVTGNLGRIFVTLSPLAKVHP